MLPVPSYVRCEYFRRLIPRQRVSKAMRILFFFAALSIPLCTGAATAEGGAGFVPGNTPLRPITGEWVGSIELNGELIYLRIEFGSQETRHTVTVHSMMPGNSGTTTPVRQRGRELRFELPGSSGTLKFSGEVCGAELAGSVTRHGQRGRFHLRRKAAIHPDLYDEYAGAYELAPQEILYIRRGDRLTVNPPSTIEKSWLYFMNDSGRIRILTPSSETTFYAGPTYLVPLPVEVEVTFVRDPNRKVTHLIWSEPASLSRIAPRTKLYREEEVRFTNGDVMLAGRLLIPSGEGPFPAVVVVHGGGPANRNWEYQIVGDVFARHGITALVYDKRGTGASTGDWREAGFDELASDAAAAFEFLRTRSEIHPKQIGFWAISEGGWVAPIATTKVSDPAFLILVSAPGMAHPELDLLYIQETLKEGGFSETVIQQALQFTQLWIEYARTGRGWSHLEARIQSARNMEWFRFTELAYFGVVSQDDWFWRWYQRQAEHDPRPVLAKLQCPVLAIYGARDSNVPVEANKQALLAALEAGNVEYTLKIFPQGDHTLLETSSSALKDFVRIKSHVPGYFEVLIEWVRDRVQAGSSPTAPLH